MTTNRIADLRAYLAGGDATGWEGCGPDDMEDVLEARLELARLERESQDEGIDDKEGS